MLKLKCLIICRKGKFKLDILYFMAITHTKTYTHTHTQCIHSALYHYSFSIKKNRKKKQKHCLHSFAGTEISDILLTLLKHLWQKYQRCSSLPECDCEYDDRSSATPALLISERCNGCQTELKTSIKRSFPFPTLVQCEMTINIQIKNMFTRHF